MSKIEIKVATRELLRMVNQAVGKSFVKTVTEPVTNSDSALKKQAGVSHSSGLVEEMLNLKVGDRVDTGELRARIRKQNIRNITVQIYTSKHGRKEARLCEIIDAGPGMTEEDLKDKFGTYASAKAKGEQTRSLFGRGAMDVLLYHHDAVIYTVTDGKLSVCRVLSEKRKRYMDISTLGFAKSSLLKAYNLPRDIAKSGTIVRFRFKDGTHIPRPNDMIQYLSSFYMLRLIAADPNNTVNVLQFRALGKKYVDQLKYDFPVGTVLGRFDDTLNLGKDGKLPVSILVARSEQPLRSDPVYIDRRENGLLFVEENDAVMDLTLLPEYDKSPYLQHIYGIVRVVGLREVLESKLDAAEPEAVLTVSRDGFDRKHKITEKLFALVEKHVKPVYIKEEHRQKKGAVHRSEKLTKAIKEALKAINEFNNTETDEEGNGVKPPPEKDEAIYFAIDEAHLYAGKTRRVSIFVNAAKVKNGEIVLFESNNPKIVVEPDSEITKFRKKANRQQIKLSLHGDVVGEKGSIKALTLGKDGKEYSACLQILNVGQPPKFVPPENIEFSAHCYSGAPNKPNQATLVANMAAFSGRPEITFWLEKHQQNVTIGHNEENRIKIKVTKKDVVPEQNIARVPIIFKGTAWGQSGHLYAKAKLETGKSANAKCRLVFERTPGDDRFTDFVYEELDRNVLADVAVNNIYVNARYSVHQSLFGKTQDDFDKALEENPAAQIRTSQIVVEAALYHIASSKYNIGGDRGLHLNPDDPITSLRSYIEESRMKLEPRVLRALAPNVLSQQE